jgi:hypothetical protein
MNCSIKCYPETKTEVFHFYPIDSTLENQRVKLSLLGMSNYKYLLEIAKQLIWCTNHLVKIDTEDLKPMFKRPLIITIKRLSNRL